MSRDTNIGKAAYEKWRELVPLGRGNPLWTDLPRSAQEGWEEIALAAVDAHLDVIATLHVHCIKGDAG